MGVDFGDPNGDGRLDVFVTNFSHETNTLYLGSDSGLFTDATDEHGLGTPSLGRLGWGARFVDFDQDGDVYPNVTESDDTTSYRQQNQVFLNRGDGVFEERTVDAESPSRGVAFGDVDGDGDVDVVVTNIDEAPSLLRNDVETGHWIGVTLVGREKQPRRQRRPRQSDGRSENPGQGSPRVRKHFFVERSASPLRPWKRNLCRRAEHPLARWQGNHTNERRRRSLPAGCRDDRPALADG